MNFKFEKNFAICVIIVLVIAYFIFGRVNSNYIVPTIRNIRNANVCPTGMIPLSKDKLTTGRPPNQYVNTKFCGDGDFKITATNDLKYSDIYYTSNTATPITLFYNPGAKSNPIKINQIDSKYGPEIY